MFEREIKFIVDFNLNKIRKSGSFFTLDKLSSAGMHPSIIKYISAELDLMIYEDRKRLLTNSMFDYSGNEISRYFGLITREIKRNKRLEFDDLKKLVIQAVSFNANHLVGPRWSLSKLIFDPAPSRTAEEISLILEYPYYYSYARNILLSYLTKKKITSMSVTEFEEVYSKLDKELFSSGDSRTLENALSSMSEFFNEGAAVKDKLSPELVLVFLKEKGLTDYSSRLRQAASPDAKQKYSINEIRSIIYGLPSQKPSAPPAPERKPEKAPEPVPVKEPEAELSEPDEIIDSVEEKSGEESRPNDENYVKVVSNLPTSVGDIPIMEEETKEAEEDLLDKPEEEVAEEIHLPIIEDTGEEPEIIEETEPGRYELELDQEEFIIDLPEKEIEELLEPESEQEITTDQIKTDEDEVKFDLENKEKLDELYEFEEQKSPETDQIKFNYTELNDAGFQFKRA